MNYRALTNCLPLLLSLTLCGVAVSEEPPLATITRRLPPAGTELPPDVRNKLKDRLRNVQWRLSNHTHPLTMDVHIFPMAVRLALDHDEFYSPKNVDGAFSLLDAADARIDALEQNKTPWADEHGTLVRGYRSSIDGSVQPYGLVIPEKLDWKSKPVPLYVWLHGRGDTKTNLAFLIERQKQIGQIAPDDAIVLHPFGRHCIGFKSAGEIDVLEAMDDVCEKYNVDRRRIVLMGFSMGGAGCWHIGAHYADHFVAMSPGAGFAETAQYQNLKPDDVPWYEAKLWGVYDMPCYTRNLFNLPVVAYSGELDKQIQAARVMEEAFAAEGKKLPHLIGPGMGHKYHPDTLKEILARMKDARDRGLDTDPDKVSLQTRTLRYHKMHWVDVQGLDEHWRDARVEARRDGEDKLRVTTKNVAALRLSPANVRSIKQISIDDQTMPVETLKRDAEQAPIISLVKTEGRWQLGPTERNSLVKLPGLQGPIDDAFLDSFIVVRPTGKCRHEAVDRWVQFELRHFIDRWRALFRGAATVMDDVDVTDEIIAENHLILWGDPQSNAVIKRLADWGPIQWGEEDITVGEKKFDAPGHVPVYIYPNRDALNRYIVVNSGPTFREGHDRTNSLQNPKLPDWAIVDLSQLPDELSPGKIVAADFFDEAWQLHK